MFLILIGHPTANEKHTLLVLWPRARLTKCNRWTLAQNVVNMEIAILVLAGPFHVLTDLLGDDPQYYLWLMKRFCPYDLGLFKNNTL